MSASELLGDMEYAEGDGQMQRLLYRMRHLEYGDREVVVRTLDALMDALGICRK